MTENGAGSTSPLVVAVVITWNDTEMTSDCVKSVLDSDYEPLRVLLVDNGSNEPCGEIVQKRFPSIEVLTLPENQGFTGGSNRGIERALEMGADYIHLIGNDSTLAPDAISNLVRALETRPEMGGASPLILHPGEQKIVQFYFGTIERDRARHVHHREEEPYEGGDWPTVASDFVPFVAVMFRKQALLEAGVFDESFSTCWEDYDLCIRFADSGWPFMTVGDAHVVHLGSITTGRSSPYITYYMTRNRLICLFRHGRARGVLREALFIARSFYWQIRHYGFRSWRCHRAFARGVLDFLLGVRGQGNAPLDRRG
ncbi:MAG: glycosyltransferase family 2 protein [Candidatus Bipolaricaulota bacterium]|nr:MAG: glycosyltransferase family 2 protein [Candidatus Bipolaricaulota bacterium]